MENRFFAAATVLTVVLAFAGTRSWLNKHTARPPARASTLAHDKKHSASGAPAPNSDNAQSTRARTPQIRIPRQVTLGSSREPTPLEALAKDNPEGLRNIRAPLGREMVRHTEELRACVSEEPGTHVDLEIDFEVETTGPTELIARNARFSDPPEHLESCLKGVLLPTYYIETIGERPFPEYKGTINTSARVIVASVDESEE